MTRLKVILTALLLFFAAETSCFAKSAHGHGRSGHGHPHVSGGANSKAKPAKGSTPAISPAKDSTDTFVTPPQRPLGDKTLKPKLVMPGPPAGRTPLPQATPVVRNAIGQPVIPREKPLAGAKGGPATPEQALRGSGPGAASGPAPPPKGSPSAAATAGSANRIDGTSVFRPSLSVSGLGGPAKVAAGINGTTLRRKR